MEQRNLPRHPDDEQLAALVNALARYRLTAPARLMLDMLAPLGVIASQTMIFVRPLLPSDRWRSYIHPLEHESGWLALQRLLHRAES